VVDESPPAAPPVRTECLTEAEVSRVRGAAPGEVPENLAHHLAGCERCQERLLFGATRPRRKRRERLAMPTSGRAFLLLAVMVAVIVAFFITLQALLGEP
jgi:hypothetical protein